MIPTEQAAPAPPAPLDLVAAFINSVDLEEGKERWTSAPALREWLLQQRLIRTTDRVTEGELRRALRARELLRQAAAAHTTGSLHQRIRRELNQFGAETQLTLSFGPDGGASLQPATGGVPGALARVLAGVYQAMLSGTWPRLKVCANPVCGWAFYDASKNRSRRWCKMTDCGNDAKGRAFRARRRSPGRESHTRDQPRLIN
jgi:predicted RNA-binding Zn ribbon-like protein